MNASRTILPLLAGAVAMLCPLATAGAQERMIVRADDVLRRTCPSTQCGVIGRFFSGEAVPVYKSVDGWSRVSGYYSAACNDGHSSFVEHGTSDCTEANGIVRGEFAEWVRSEYLAADTRT